MELGKLRFQNKYWDNKKLLNEDFHLKQLYQAPFILFHPIEKDIKLNEDRIYIVRGPRQIGKTTFLKK